MLRLPSRKPQKSRKEKEQRDICAFPQHIPGVLRRIPSHRSHIANCTGPPIIRPLAVRFGSPSRTKKRPSGPNPSPHSWQTKQRSCHCPPIAVMTRSSRTCCLQPRQRGAVRRPWHWRHHAKPSFSTKGVVELKGYRSVCVSKCGSVGRRHMAMGKSTYITTFGAEKVANMPLCATCHDNFALNGCLTALAARTE